MFIRNINLQIENETLNFLELAQSMCVAFDYLDYQPGVDNRKVRLQLLFSSRRLYYYSMLIVS